MNFTCLIESFTRSAPVPFKIPALSLFRSGEAERPGEVDGWEESSFLPARKRRGRVPHTGCQAAEGRGESVAGSFRSGFKGRDGDDAGCARSGSAGLNSFRAPGNRAWL